MKTCAAILVEQHKPLVIDEVEIPALEFGQVLVEVKASRICGSRTCSATSPAIIRGPSNSRIRARHCAARAV